MALTATERAKRVDIKSDVTPTYPQTRQQLIISLAEDYGMIYDGSNTSIGADLLGI